MFSENKSRIAKILGGVALSMAVATAWWHFFIPDLTPKTKPTTVKQLEITQPKIAETSQQTHNEWDGFYPKYFVVPNSEENHTIQGISRFSQKIYVPLWLSREELEKNLAHAAWDLLKKKNADAVMIFAYRSDDSTREGGYSAGRYILAPYGDWSKPTKKHSDLDLKPNIDIATVYFKNEPTLKLASRVIINANNTNLYASENCEQNNVIAKLRKGTEAIITKSERIFTANEFIDIYKIRINTRKNKNISGWVFGDKLNQVEDTQKSKTNQNVQLVNKPKKTKEWYEGGTLHHTNVRGWRNSTYENKLATCADFLAIGIQKNLFHFEHINEYILKVRTQELLYCVDSYVNGSDRSEKIESQNISDVVALAALLLGWVK